MELERWSFLSVVVTPYDHGVPLGSGTGFVIEDDSGALYLVSNYHVLAGRHPTSDAPMDNEGLVPDRVLVCLPYRGADPEKPPQQWGHHVQLLQSEDHTPQLVLHPKRGRAFDVAVLPLRLPPHLAPMTFNRVRAIFNIALAPGGEITVIGFPNGLTGGGVTPIWKTGHIASEPSLLVDNEDYFWIDANTRGGMSGSPVMVRRFGQFLDEKRDLVFVNGAADRIVGVYAGRAPLDKDETLGRVWRWRGVEDIIVHAQALGRAGTVAPQPATLHHFSRPGCPTIPNRRLDPSDPALKTMTSAGFLSLMATHATQLGRTIDGVRLSATIVAACAAADDDDFVDMPPGAPQALIECLDAPKNWQATAAWSDALLKVREDLAKSIEP